MIIYHQMFRKLAQSKLGYSKPIGMTNIISKGISPEDVHIDY